RGRAPLVDRGAGALRRRVGRRLAGARAGATPARTRGAEGEGVAGAMATMIERWEERARRLKREVYAIYLAYKDPRVPWYARVFAACVVGYAFSPIDLILVPLGVALALKMIPPPVLAECRAKASE